MRSVSDVALGAAEDCRGIREALTSHGANPDALHDLVAIETMLREFQAAFARNNLAGHMLDVPDENRDDMLTAADSLHRDLVALRDLTTQLGLDPTTVSAAVQAALELHGALAHGPLRDGAVHARTPAVEGRPGERASSLDHVMAGLVGRLQK